MRPDDIGFVNTPVPLQGTIITGQHPQGGARSHNQLQRP